MTVNGDHPCNSTPQLHKISDVMDLLKIVRTGVYELFKSGQLSWVQVGGHRRVTGAELQRYVDAQTRNA